MVKINVATGAVVASLPSPAALHGPLLAVAITRDHLLALSPAGLAAVSLDSCVCVVFVFACNLV